MIIIDETAGKICGLAYKPKSLIKKLLRGVYEAGETDAYKRLRTLFLRRLSEKKVKLQEGLSVNEIRKLIV